MPKAPYKLSILNAAFDYYLVAGGNVSTSPFEVLLKSAIVDWATLSLNYKRDGVFWGVIRAYSPQKIKFVKDAARILRYVKNTQGGAEAIAYLKVSVLNKTTQQYDFLDYWQFDFSQNSNQLNYYDLAIMEAGLSGRLKAFASQNYSIVLNDPSLAPGASGELAVEGQFPEYNTLPADSIALNYPSNWNTPIAPEVPYLVYMDGIPILGQVQFVTLSTGENITNTSNTVDDGLAVIGLSQSMQIGDFLGSIGTFGNPLVNNTSHSPLNVGSTMSDTVILTGNQFASSVVRIAYNLNFSYTNTQAFGGYGIKIHLRYSLYDQVPSGTWGTLVGGSSVLIKEDSIFIGPGDVRQIAWKGESEPIDVAPGFLIAIGFVYETIGAPPGILHSDLDITFPASDVLNPLPAITLKCSFIPDKSVTRAITHYQLFRQLTAYLATNGGIMAAPMSSDPSEWIKSDLLKNGYPFPGNMDLCPQNTLFSCGDALRGLTVNTIVDPTFNDGLPFDQMVQPAIYTNFNDFAKDLFTDAGAGIGIERTDVGTDRMVVETLDYFLDDSVIIADLGRNIANFEMIDFNDYKGSSITFGQADQQFDSINGPLETMSEVDRSLPSMRTIKNIDFKTPYRSDPYGIELIRANIGNKTNTNSSSDNDTVKLQVVNLVPETLSVLEQWGSLSGYEPIISGSVTVQALMLLRAEEILSGLPNELLTPNVFQDNVPDLLSFSMYNLTFSPMRKALRVLPWLCSNYRGLMDSLMGITGKKKNIMLQSDLGSGIVTENEWINLSDEPQTYTPPFSSTPVTVNPAPIPAGKTTALLFKPFIFSFTGPSIKGLPKLMTPPGTLGGGKMYGKIVFEFVRGSEVFPLSGFVMDIGMYPGSNAAYSYKLLCSPTVEIPDYL